jgi:phenylacetate-CoA ligase
MYRAFHRHVLLAGFETFYKRRKTFRYLRELERSQWLDPAQLGALQLDALKNVLTHALAHCDFYREKWQEQGLDPKRLECLADFQSWPLIDRNHVRASRQQMRARVSGMRLIAKSTGGSTGEPVQFDLDWDSNDRRTAAAYRGYGWAGAAPGTRQLHLWGVPLVEQARGKRVKDAIFHRLHRRRFLSTFGLGDDQFRGYFDFWNSYKPQVVVAYTGSLYDFARMIQARGLKPFSPQAIVVGAEKLHPFQRQLIEHVFAAPVFETYGSREFMLIGAECERHEGLHLTQENLLVEVLNPDGTPSREGEEGEVVVTDLFNYGMPFIRYRTGDRAIAGWTSCSCGRGLPLLRSVTGRTMDTLTTPDGRRVSGALFPHLLKDFPSVSRFQVIQDQPDHIELRVVLSEGWNDSDRRNIENIVRSKLGQSVRFDLVKVNDIPLTGAGKLRVVINQCDPHAVGTIHAAQEAPAEIPA